MINDLFNEIFDRKANNATIRDGVSAVYILLIAGALFVKRAPITAEDAYMNRLALRCISDATLFLNATEKKEPQ